MSSTTVVLLDKCHCKDVARIWKSGLQQTVDASNWFWRPMMSYAMHNLALKACSADGDIGPDGINLLENWANKSDRVMFVAVNDGVVIGVCGAKRGIDEKSIASEDCDVFSAMRLSVDEKARRKGVATALMQAVENWAKERHGQKMVLYCGNPVASKLYCERMGYIKIGFSGVQHEKMLI